MSLIQSFLEGQSGAPGESRALEDSCAGRWAGLDHRGLKCWASLEFQVRVLVGLREGVPRKFTLVSAQGRLVAGGQCPSGKVLEPAQ